MTSHKGYFSITWKSKGGKMLTANNYELVQNCVEAIIQYSHATLFTQLSIKVYNPPTPPLRRRTSSSTYPWHQQCPQSCSSWGRWKGAPRRAFCGPARTCRGCRDGIPWGSSFSICKGDIYLITRTYNALHYGKSLYFFIINNIKKLQVPTMNLSSYDHSVHRWWQMGLVHT